MLIDLVKGGWDINAPVTDRIAVSQRPADGHIKSAEWEDTTLITAQNIKGCDGTVEVGDVIAIHTTPTLGFITGIGISVEQPVEGLKLKLVTLTDNLDLEAIKYRKATYDSETEQFSAEDAATLTGEFGDEQAWYAGHTEVVDDGFIENTDVIGLEVTALPDEGIEGLRIVSRMQFKQPARPPAYMNCCGA